MDLVDIGKDMTSGQRLDHKQLIFGFVAEIALKSSAFEDFASYDRVLKSAKESSATNHQRDRTIVLNDVKVPDRSVCKPHKLPRLTIDIKYIFIDHPICAVFYDLARTICPIDIGIRV